VQVTLFVNDTTVTKGMVKYASQITRESIVDIEGKVKVPASPITSCSQSEVSWRTRGAP
jgi:aspartyl-tRNA synthetase